MAGASKGDLLSFVAEVYGTEFKGRAGPVLAHIAEQFAALQEFVDALSDERVRDLVEIQKAPRTMAKFFPENRLPSHKRSLDENCSSDSEGAKAQGCFW